MVVNKFTICKACKVLLKGTNFCAVLKAHQMKPQCLNVDIKLPQFCLNSFIKVIHSYFKLLIDLLKNL